jgi:type I restriction enzyme S subunit
MNSTWEKVTIGQIAQIKGGKRVPKGYKFETTQTKYPYITVSSFTNNGSINLGKVKYVDESVYDQIRNYTISTNDLYLSIAGTIGKTGIIPDHLDGSLLTENACKLVLNEEIDKYYIYYFSLSDSFIDQAQKNTRVAAQPKLALSRIKNITLMLPPLPEQKSIVAILDEAFEGINQAIANTERNLANARELFDSYLEDVYSIQGKNWEVSILKEVCVKIQDGSHFSPQKIYNAKGPERYPYITSKNIRNNYMNLSKVQYVDSDFHKSIFPRCNPEFGDVLLTKDGANTGNVTLNTIREPFSLLSSVCLIKTDQEKLLPSFLKYYIQSKHGFQQITGKMTGAAIKRIILKTIKSATIPLPDLSSQHQLVAKMDLLNKDVENLTGIYSKKKNLLNQLKQSILQKAFSGELTETYVKEKV